jgi:hypothetical protein
MTTLPRYNIDTAAMIVEFNASVWTARKLDKTTTDEVIHDKNAKATDAARVNKHLLAGRNELSVIQKHVAAVRQFVYDQTLPWSDNGQRLLPATKFIKFEQDMDTRRQEFDALVAAFVKAYPTLITAQAMALGDMFKRDDFPSPHEIASKFAWSLGYLPVPTANDFRIQVGDAAQAELKEKLERLAKERVEAAHKDLWERLHTHLSRMSDRLQVDNVNGEEKPRRFHDTLVSGGLELCEMLKDLNLTKDQSLENARTALEKTLLGVDAEELRKNMDARNHVKTEVNNILSKFQW